ncbi:hypothetical protein [Salmonella phage SSBI34]|nr:hypothetical protein [Salmonella phage SSBI34]
MKRTKSINKSRFRKSFAGAAVAIALTFSLTACEQADETVKFYQNAEECVTGGNPAETCKLAEEQAKKVATETAPRFATLEDCRAEFGDMCQNNSSGGNSDSPWMPLMMGYMLGNMMSNNGSNHYYHNSSPMYKSKSGKWMDNKFRSYNVTPGKTFKVSKSAIKPKAQAPKSTISGSNKSSSSYKSTTTTRGGFGSSVGRSSGGSFGG